MTPPGTAAVAFRAERRAAFVNMAFKALSVPVEKGSRLLVVVVAAPWLGAAAFGTYQLATTATSLLMLGTEMGLGVWTTRALARDRSRAAGVLGTVLWRRGVALVPYAALVASIAILAGPGDTRSAFAFLSVAAAANAAVDYACAIVRGFERLKDEAWINVVRALVIAGAALATLSLRRSAGALAAGTAAGAMMAAAYAVSVLRRRYGLLVAGDGVAYDRALARSAVAEGVPLWAVTVVGMLYFKGDVIIMRAFVDDAEIGAYSAAYKIFESLTILAGIVLAAGFPQLVRAHGDRDRQRRWETLLGALLLGAGAVGGAVLYAGGALIIATVYGTAFTRAAASLRVLAFAAPLTLLNFALTHILIARRLEQRNLALASVTLLVNVGANLVLIPRLGGPGAAWATLATEATMTAACFGVLSREESGKSEAN
jgi:O-antigen/teichoic acid export membrane protein